MNALFQSFPGIANVALVCILFYLIFGILGLNLLISQYGYCMDVETGEALNEAWLWDLSLPPERLAAFMADTVRFGPLLVSSLPLTPSSALDTVSVSHTTSHFLGG